MEPRGARVLDAAVAGILDQGYSRTCSNEIARRAGVAWGTLRHQFGGGELTLWPACRSCST
jgi:AcrR family transcriptional regulator